MPAIMAAVLATSKCDMAFYYRTETNSNTYEVPFTDSLEVKW